MDWLKKLLTSEQGKNKWVETFAIAALIGIILLIGASSLFGKKTDPAKQNYGTQSQQSAGNQTSDKNLEKQLEDVLSQIRGSGKVRVMISYSTSKEIVPAADVKKSDSTTGEKDTQGGTRTINQNQYESKVIYEEQSGIKKPIILKEINPEIKGVLVVAEGAGDPIVSEKISRGVQVLLDIPLHKIQVLEKVKEGSK